MSVRRCDEIVYTDWIPYSSKVGKGGDGSQGMAGCQIFVGGETKLIHGVQLKKESENIQAMEEFISEVGAPIRLRIMGNQWYQKNGGNY